MPEQTLALPNIPKFPLARYLKATPHQNQTPVTVTGPDAVTVSQEPTTATVSDGLNAWLHAASPNETRITIPAGLHTDEPIVITGPPDSGARMVVTVGSGAEVTIQERWQSEGVDLAVWLELQVEDNAQVHWLSDDRFAASHVIVQRQAVLKDHAHLNWTLAGFASNSGLNRVMVDLVGANAHATVNVGVLAAGDQHLGYTTAVTNIGRHSVGHINQRGVITGKAHLIFNGIGHIEKGARGSDAQQENRVLMLSKQAQGDANPILLIDENDVTAGHAASVTRINADQLYYLMSRGLPLALAQRLVIRGFLEAGLAEIDDQSLKQTLFDKIDETLVTAHA